MRGQTLRRHVSIGGGLTTWIGLIDRSHTLCRQARCSSSREVMSAMCAFQVLSLLVLYMWNQRPLAALRSPEDSIRSSSTALRTFSTWTAWGE